MTTRRGGRAAERWGRGRSRRWAIAWLSAAGIAGAIGAEARATGTIADLTSDFTTYQNAAYGGWRYTTQPLSGGAGTPMTWDGAQWEASDGAPYLQPDGDAFAESGYWMWAYWRSDVSGSVTPTIYGLDKLASSGGIRLRIYNSWTTTGYTYTVAGGSSGYFSPGSLSIGVDSTLWFGVDADGAYSDTAVLDGWITGPEANADFYYNGSSNYTLVGTSRSIDAAHVENHGDYGSSVHGTITGSRSSSEISSTGTKSITQGGDGLVGQNQASDPYYVTYAPTARGTDSVSFSGTFNGWNATDNSFQTTQDNLGKVNLTGVAPVQSTSASTNAGKTLVGTSNYASVTVQNVGNGNLDATQSTSVSNLKGTFGAAAGEFSTSSSSINLGDGAATTKTYAYAPTARGVDSTSVTVSFSNGNSSGNNTAQTLYATLQGQGVAPLAEVTHAGAGAVRIGTSGSASLTVANLGDGNKAGADSPVFLSNLHADVVLEGAGDLSGAGGSLRVHDMAAV